MDTLPDGTHASSMPLTLIDTVGFAAGALTTAAFVPQVLKSWQTRD